MDSRSECPAPLAPFFGGRGKNDARLRRRSVPSFSNPIESAEFLYGQRGESPLIEWEIRRAGGLTSPARLCNCGFAA